MRAGLPGDGDFCSGRFAGKVGQLYSGQRRVLHQEVAHRAAESSAGNRKKSSAACSGVPRLVYIAKGASWQSHGVVVASKGVRNSRTTARPASSNFPSQVICCDSGDKRVPVPAKLHLVLLVHAHQPVGNFGSVFEQTYSRCYLPFVQVLERHPDVHVGLHYSGPLLTWIEENHPEYFEKLRALSQSGQVEMVGGGFYEPILISIPPADQHEQITRLADYVEQHFSRRPAGSWLAERVWEPQLASILAEAGVEYTVLDDIHFLSAG